MAHPIPQGTHPRFSSTVELTKPGLQAQLHQQVAVNVGGMNE